MTIPRDLLDEIHRELLDSSRTVRRECDRLAELIELNRLAVEVSIRVGRPLSVVDLLEHAEEERGERLAALVRSLRADAADGP
jgi:hypothetical protein